MTCSNVGAQQTQAPVKNYDNDIVSSNPLYTAVVDTVMDTTVPSFVPCTNPSSENQVPVVQEPQAIEVHKNYLLNPHHLGTPSFTSTYTTQVHFPTLPQHPTSSVVATTIPQHPTSCVVAPTLPQHPTHSVVAPTLPQHPTSSVIASTLPQHPTHSVFAPNLPQHLTDRVIAPTLSQHPSYGVTQSNPYQPVSYNPGSYASCTQIFQPVPVQASSLNPQAAFQSGQHPRCGETNLQVKKMSLPAFNGLRKDWPEFEAVWKSVAEAVYTNKTALAHELKRSVKGESNKRIRSVYITKPGAYDVEKVRELL